MKTFQMLAIIVIVLFMVTGCQSSQDNHLKESTAQESHTIDENQGFGDGEHEIDYSHGELIYIPIYSSIFHCKGLRTYELTATLSIHNIGLENSIRLTKVDYYNTNGELIKKYAKDELELKPLQTVHFVIEEDDTSGGTGANFIVEWMSEFEVSKPSPSYE